MGQKTSKNSGCTSNMKDIGKEPKQKRRGREMRLNSNQIDLQSISGLESNRNIDCLLSKMGISHSMEQNTDSDLSDVDEVSKIDDVTKKIERVHQLYDMHINRYKARFSAMYPEHSENGTVRISRFRSDTMLEILSYLDTPSKLHVKSVNRYFRKLVNISHNEVSLTTREGWFSDIHLSSFLSQIKLYGKPRDKDLKDFALMIRNDGFTELRSLELHNIGESALLEILDALSQRLKRAARLGILDNSVSAELTIYENEFTPYFATKFSELIDGILFRILTKLKIMVNSPDGLSFLLKETHLWKCSRLSVIDFSKVMLSHQTFDLFANSIWKEDTKSGLFPPISELLLSNTGLTDACIISLAHAISRGYLLNLEKMDLTANCISFVGFKTLSSFFSQFLCPNIHALILSDNSTLSNGSLSPFLIQLANGTCPMLEILEVNNCGLNTSDIDAMGIYIGSPFSENLKVLNLGNNTEIYPALAQFFQCLKRFKQVKLQSINLEGVKLSFEMIGELCDWIKYGNVKDLHYLLLNNNHIDQTCVYQIFSAFIVSNIEELAIIDFSSNFIGSFNEKMWEQLVFSDLHPKRLLKIRQIDISHNPCSNDDLNWIITFIKRFVIIDCLKEASFEDNNISARGICNFLNAFPREIYCELIYLTIVSLNIRCIGKDLNRWLCSPASCNLQKLILMNCCLCKMDLTYLINALEVSDYCKSIRVLKLSGNNEIDDEFIKDFVRIYSIEGILPVIYELDLMYTCVTKIGASILLGFFERNRNYSLRRLNLAYTKMSEHRIGVLFSEFEKVLKGGCIM